MIGANTSSRWTKTDPSTFGITAFGFGTTTFVSGDAVFGLAVRATSAVDVLRKFANRSSTDFLAGVFAGVLTSEVLLRQSLVLRPWRSVLVLELLLALLLVLLLV